MSTADTAEVAPWAHHVGSAFGQERHLTAAGEIRAAGQATGDALAGFVDAVAGVHDAVSLRIADHLSPVSRPVAHAQRGIARGIYHLVAEAHRAAPKALATVVSGRVSDGSVAPSETPAGRAALRVVNGFWGDSIATRHPELTIEMAVRSDHRDVPPDPDALASAFPGATPSLAVFVHGLAEDDASWRRGASATYGERLLRDAGITPVSLRYNSGRHVSDNGRDLCALLDALVAAWPVPVGEVSLIGHSMGGLVARSAAHVGARARELGAGGAWIEPLRTIVTLATPHGGAPLEKASHVFDWLLSRTPETEPFGKLMRARSAGVKDLRYGNVVDEDWQGADPDEFLTDRRTEVPFLDHVTYCFMAATLTRSPHHPLGILLGDGLVRRARAWCRPSSHAPGRSPSESVTTERIAMREWLEVSGHGHFAVLSSPAVYAHLTRWLTTHRAPAAPA